MAAQCAGEPEEVDPGVQVVHVSSARLFISPAEYRDKVVEVCEPLSNNREQPHWSVHILTLVTSCCNKDCCWRSRGICACNLQSEGLRAELSELQSTVKAQAGEKAALSKELDEEGRKLREAELALEQASQRQPSTMALFIRPQDAMQEQK